MHRGIAGAFMGIRLLLLRLEGPLQSWGERSKWDFRDSAYMPTKSGVIGLIACAMGEKRGSSVITALNEVLSMSVRVDRPGNVGVDYQTISGILHTADGGQRGKKNEETTIVSRRQYLQDASFLVAIGGDDALLEQCAQALQHPVWTVFLGRKCCPPTKPILYALTDRYVSAEDAFSHEPLAERSTGQWILYQTEAADGTMLRYDTAVGARAFHGRTVQEGTMEVEG